MEQQEQSSTHSRFGQSESNFSFQTSNMALKNADIARELEPRSSRSLSINQNETINSEAILKRIRCKKNNLTAIDNYFCEENCSKNKTNNVGGEEFFDLRCSSLQIEELQKSRQLQQQRRRSSAGYPGLAFGSPMFSNTLFKFSLIANELKDLKQNQLRKVGIDCCVTTFVAANYLLLGFRNLAKQAFLDHFFSEG
ncbi:hypothetical protein QR98_0070960 [Sarcoptes scabiei]|uniref:Uncharacterized protein n=1 Tax=Sarcoptes scabiei TaxID=52283 RepID=A0A132AC51_SARSC|nr:hypothetical protein QR98_0070960 [Sarcoptes scabiei]